MITATGNAKRRKLRKLMRKAVPSYCLNEWYEIRIKENSVLIYSSTKPLTKTFGAVPTRLDKPPIVAE
jgi:hypothetical protein